MKRTVHSVEATTEKRNTPKPVPLQKVGGKLFGQPARCKINKGSGFAMVSNHTFSHYF
jgi:hypothetical protein